MLTLSGVQLLFCGVFFTNLNPVLSDSIMKYTNMKDFNIETVDTLSVSGKPLYFSNSNLVHVKNNI